MKNIDLVAQAENVIGYSFNDPELLMTCLTHSSCATSRVDSNERLEFLGDAVLGMIVCTELYRRFSDWLEGDLTKVKSVIVSRRVCAKIADSMGLAELLILGNGIDRRGPLPTSLRAAVFESIIGAIFLDTGLEAATEFILGVIPPHIDECLASDHHENYKSALQQYAQQQLSSTPYYEALDEQGPDHSKCFEVGVSVAGRRYPSAWGPTKKQAEQEAAKRALEIIRHNGTSGHIEAAS